MAFIASAHKLDKAKTNPAGRESSVEDEESVALGIVTKRGLR